MTAPLRVANCSGFYGDRLSAAREMVTGGHIDVLTGDWLAELTMLILAKGRARDPRRAWAGTFLVQLEEVLGECLDRGIRVVSNAGGLDPAGCAAAVAELADRLGIAPVVAHVTGDDLHPRLPGVVARLTTMDGAPATVPERTLAANAYLGGWGIAHALGRGADVVVTGRVTDASLTVGPAAWHHRWRLDDWDRLAGATVAGHVIECGTQATGGNYSFFTEVPGAEHLGFPWAEVHEDGSAVIGKHEGTGGLVSTGTVTSQLLYEIGGPEYAGPDVRTRLDTVRVEQVGPDRVRVHGATGRPPSGLLKVALTEDAGYRNEVEVAITGLDAEAKATAVEAAFWCAAELTPEDFEYARAELSGRPAPDPRTNAEATCRWRLVVRDPDEAKVGRTLSGTVVEIALASVPGFYLPAGAPSGARSYGVHHPLLIPAPCVEHVVHLPGEPPYVVPDPPTRAAAEVPSAGGSARTAPPGATARVPLGRLVGARSGDKGGDANLGVFARNDEVWAWLDGWLDAARLKELLPELGPLTVTRYRLPLLRAVNFVCTGLLDAGVAASPRPDPQAKSLAEWLRARVVDVPAHLTDRDQEET